jgi:Leucine-rich repeat (LRR) protein
MYLNSQSYEKKYLKYKRKYKLLKIIIGGAKGTLLNGGDCDPLPNPEEEDIVSRENLLDLCPEERITIQNKCYDVKNLYKWIITNKQNTLPSTQTDITGEEKQKLIQAYVASLHKISKIPKIPNIPNVLTREKLIQIYPNLEQETYINLKNRGYTNINIGVFDDLPNLKYLNLDYNYIQELLPYTFNNLPSLEDLIINHNQIQEILPNAFNILPKLIKLTLNNNQITKIESGIFNNLQNLGYLQLENNQIIELQSNIFNSRLTYLFLYNNPIPESDINFNWYYGLSSRSNIVRSKYYFY